MSEHSYVREARVVWTRKRIEGPRLEGPEHVARLLQTLTEGEGSESFWAVFLDGRHRYSGHAIISRGTATASLVHPREVFRAAIKANAVAIIIGHNHPSGDPSPSDEDRRVTVRLRDAGKLLGIEVLDHVVVTDDGGHYSFREEGDEI